MILFPLLSGSKRGSKKKNPKLNLSIVFGQEKTGWPHWNAQSDTPPKFNIEPENNGLEDDFPFPGGPYSQVPAVKLQGCTFEIVGWLKCCPVSLKPGRFTFDFYRCCPRSGGS